MKTTVVLLSALLAFMPFSCFADELPPQRGLDIVDISFMSLGPAAQRLLEAREHRDPEIVLHFDSPGGELRTMFAFAALMRHVQLGGTKITCVVDGMAASAGLYLLEVCDTRLATPGSVYLAHEVSATLEGKPSDIERASKMMHDLSDVYLRGIAARLNISFEELKKRTTDKDYWFSAEEAVQIGAVDRIISREEALQK